jgi:hypothetical protein
MKTRNSILAIALMLCFLSCDPLVTFTTPQPTGADNLSEIPNRLQGEYFSFDNGSVLRINEKVIQRSYDFEVKSHKDQLSNDEQLSGDTLFNMSTQRKTPVKIEGDSLITRFHFVDTIFQISEKNILRKFKGYYFLNMLYSENSWEVRKLQLSKGELTVSSIRGQDDIDHLKKIAESANDTVPPYRFTANRKQLKKYIKDEGFSMTETFVRQKKE